MQKNMKYGAETKEIWCRINLKYGAEKYEI